MWSQAVATGGNRWNVLETLDRASTSQNSCKQAVDIAHTGAKLIPSSLGRESSVSIACSHENSFLQVE
jgi:hypothetical protein